VTVATLEVAVSRRRAYGLLGSAAVLAGIALLSDPAGRLLAVPAAVAVLALAVRDLRSGPLLLADDEGVDVLQGLRRVRAPWSSVERMRVVKDRRTELLELDIGRTLVLLSRQRLGRPPQDVLTELLAIRSGPGPVGGAPPG